MEDIKTITLPIVCSIEEAKEWARDFKSILTVGPRQEEVTWGHPNHKVFSFGDTTIGANAPKIHQIKEAIEWGAEQEDLMVHCHAGMSRSTSTAWGIAMYKGADPLESFLALREAQPRQQYGRSQVARDFIPNKLIVRFLEEILQIDGLEQIRKTHSTYGWTY